jgi:hypothetical protein
LNVKVDPATITAATIPIKLCGIISAAATNIALAP